MYSLQRRVILGGLLWAITFAVVGGVTVISIFGQFANQRFDETLEERHDQLIVALGNTPSPASLANYLADPVYARPLSGHYWQVEDENGNLLTSQSLFDAVLPNSEIEPVSSAFWEGDGPDGPVRGISERVTLDDGSVWTASVARSLSTLDEQIAELRRSVIIAFGAIGALILAGAALLTTVLVQPLRSLGVDVSRRWEAGTLLVPSEYPQEVSPLVEDINELLRRNQEIVKSGRRQAADFAHSVKTPSAALRNELNSLEPELPETERALEALDRIDKQIARALSRSRMSTAANAVNIRADLDSSLKRLERLFRSLPESSGKTLEVSSVKAAVAADPQDLEEMIGNVLDNAFKWSESTVRLSASNARSWATICVEDDGPGIAPDLRAVALKEGERLDTSIRGSGLGLAIANDLVKAVGGSLELSASQDLGGLAVRIQLRKLPNQTVPST